MEFTQIRYELDRGVALVTLNRPERLNAWTPVMRDQLKEALALADADDGVRVVVVTGAGRGFCAGADLSGGGETFAQRGPDGGEVRLEDHRDGGGQAALAAWRCRKPVIAAINGPAVGVGMTMTLGMDIRIVAEDAKCGFVFARRGVVPEACSTWFLPRLVGPAKAAELIFSARVFRAADEAASGLFSRVLPAPEVLPTALALAREMSEGTSAVSLALAKGMLHRGLMEPTPEAMHLIDSRVFLWAGRSADAREGIESFLEKRPPRFVGSPVRDAGDMYGWLLAPEP